MKTSYINRFGEAKIKETICWFAPSLSDAYGSKDFNGLPGLILELTEDNKTFTTSKIELLNNDVAVDFPKDKTVTKEKCEKKT